MDNIYNIKYKKYKKKYILLKQFIQEGGDIKYIGKGASGCLFCPPFNPIDIKQYLYSEIYYKISDFSFEKYDSCNYVGKILAIKKQGFGFDSYENELEKFKKIKDLDPNGDYTPKLIYANIHLKNELLEKLKDNNYLYDCVNNKIKIDEFGYIISKHTGISLLKKYGKIIETDIRKIKNFLKNFNKLLEFIEILNKNNYLHLDIKLDNITIKEEEDDKLYLIDFGRTTEIKNGHIRPIINNYLRGEHEMYPFEPKIFYNLYQKYNLNSKYYNDIINDVKNNFNNLIKPYLFPKDNFLYNILVKLFIKDFEKDQAKNEEEQKKIFYSIKKMLGFNCEDENKCLNIDNYIKYHQKNNFINYLYNRRDELLANNLRGGFSSETMLTRLFDPIIKNYDIYCMGIVLADIVLLSHDFDNCNEIFKEKFIELIKKILFYKITNVDDFRSEINELIEIL